MVKFFQITIDSESIHSSKLKTERVLRNDLEQGITVLKMSDGTQQLELSVFSIKLFVGKIKVSLTKPIDEDTLNVKYQMLQKL